jgi:lipopolysaccharide export system permease protein
MRVAGASLFRIFLPIFVTGLVVSIADFYFGEYVVPASIVRYIAVLDELPGKLTHLTPPAGQYISIDQKYVVGVRTLAQRNGYIDLSDINVNSGIRFFTGSEAPFVAVAKTGRYQDGIWTLYNAQIYTYDLSDLSKFNRATAREFRIPISVDPQSFQSGFQLQMPMGTMAQHATSTFGQLGQELESERKHHIADYNTLLDYYFKLSVPFSCLVMALCCAPIAMRFGRGGGFMGTLLAICLVFVYWNTLLLARILGTPGPTGGPPLLPPVVAAWSQNVLFVLLGLFVLHKSE